MITRFIRLVLGLTAVLTAAPVFPIDWSGSPPVLSEIDNPNYREWFSLAEESPETSTKLNALGYQAYSDGRLVEAARLWKAALLIDPENPWPHYNYASILGVFAGGFGDFDAPGDRLPKIAWQRDDFWDYRNTIIRHLKTSITLLPERLERVHEDSDFDAIRELPEFINVVMGPHPDVATVLRKAPKWYSLQPGAFLPEDILTFSQDGNVEYEWDAAGRVRAFSSLYKEGDDDSFSGTWRIVGDTIEITTDDGRQYICDFAHTVDDNGFIKDRILMFDRVKYGDYDSHYWEGQDG